MGKRKLLFQQIRNVGLAILADALEGNVDPVVTGFVVLPYQLVEQSVFEKTLYPLTTDGDGWEMQVGSFAFHVQAGGESSNCSVEGGATIATADDDWHVEVLAKRFKDVLAEL